MSDPSPETPHATTDAAPDAGRGVHARQDARPKDPLRPRDWGVDGEGTIALKAITNLDGSLTAMLTFETGIAGRGRLRFGPNNAILVGRALVEMGEAMKAVAGPPDSSFIALRDPDGTPRYLVDGKSVACEEWNRRLMDHPRVKRGEAMKSETKGDQA